MTQDTLRLILDKNPGLLSILLTGVLLPLGILWLTNVHNRKQKETEKSLDSKYNSKRLENELKNKGAIYSKKEDWVSYVVKDGLLITGQNPASSKEVAKQLLITLNAHNIIL
jgi:hypothetical protein